MSSELGLVAESEPVPDGGGPIGPNKGLSGPSMYALLVRESVQNSWDARDDERGNSLVHFSMAGFDLDSTEIESLRAVMPVAALEGFNRLDDDDDALGLIHPRVALERDRVKLLVISDRNTLGLCGPTRGGVRWDPVRLGRPMPRGQQRFANFVRNSGKPAGATGKGDGGSFGIGKSALWMSSECATVLIHSRTTDEHGEPVDRFIGSIWGNDFESGDRQYTGRHFIGTRSRPGLVDPLEGAAAARAIEGLPVPKYEVDGRPAFGTTMIIVAPRMHLPWEWEMSRLRDAIRWHVWPKRVPSARGAGTAPDMEMRLSWNHNVVDVPAPLDDIEIRPYALALQHCGLQRNCEDSTTDSKKLDFEARCGRPIQRLGDLKFREGGHADDNVFHITQTAAEFDDDEGRTSKESEDELIDFDPVVDFTAPWGKIALVRREPLLLVKYEPIAGPFETQRFVGVFLSEDDPDVEAALTKAEPPAHDDWNDRNVPKEHKRDHRRTYVKRTLAEIRRITREFSGQYRSGDSGSSGRGEQKLSELISGTGGGGLGGAVIKRPGGIVEPTPPKPKKPTADLQSVDTWPAQGGAIHEINVTLLGLGEVPENVELQASAKGVDNTGSVPIDGLVTFEWRFPDQTVVVGESAVVSAADDFKCSLVIRVAGDFRIRPKVSVVKRAMNA